MNYVLIRGALFVPLLLAACYQGGPLDILRQESENSPDGGTKSDLVGTPNIGATERLVDFTYDGQTYGSSNCTGLTRTNLSDGGLSLDGKGINLGTPTSGVTTVCSVRSGPIVLPANAKKTVLKFKTYHDFNTECSAPCQNARITWGTIQFVDHGQSPGLVAVYDLRPSFHEVVPVGNSYSVAIELPSFPTLKSIDVAVSMNGFAQAPSAGSKFPYFSWNLSGMKVEITQ